MLKRNYLFILLLIAALFCLSTTVDESEFVSYEKSCSISETTYTSSYLASYSRSEQVNELIGLIQQVKLFALWTVVFFLSLLFISKKASHIFLAEMQYFIADLRVDILSSRAHPPTT